MALATITTKITESVQEEIPASFWMSFSTFFPITVFFMACSFWMFISAIVFVSTVSYIIVVGGCTIYKAPIFPFHLLVWYILRTFAKEMGQLGEKTPSNRLYKNFSLLSQNHKTLKFDRQEAVFSNVQMVPGGHHL